MLVFLVGESRFPLGTLTATAAALDRLSPADMSKALLRHGRCDWGELDDEDRELNDAAFLSGERILSVYTGERGQPFWIITEADRSRTTFLLPSDY